jgi:hypothetical protein
MLDFLDTSSVGVTNKEKEIKGEEDSFVLLHKRVLYIEI